jgi:hypothetical protein
MNTSIAGTRTAIGTSTTTTRLKTGRHCLLTKIEKSYRLFPLTKRAGGPKFATATPPRILIQRVFSDLSIRPGNRKLCTDRERRNGWSYWGSNLTSIASRVSWVVAAHFHL